MRFSYAVSAALLVGLSHLAGADSGKVARQAYKWDNVTIVGGGFVSGILFHPGEKDLAYARTDIGGAYRWDPRGKHWIPLVDWIQRPDWNLYGIESIGLDPTDPKRLYLACGTYTNEWAGNGAILRSTDQGRTFQRTDMPFKFGGNMDGRSMGERLAVDPNLDSIVYFGSRQSGLWKSLDYGATWGQVDSFPIKGPTNGIGIGFEAFDTKTGKRGQPTPTIYVGVASTKAGLYQSSDGGATWSAVPGQPVGVYPHHAAFDPEGDLILTYCNGPGPNGVNNGGVWKLNPRTATWTDISPVKSTAENGFGYAGLSLDAEHPGTMVVTTLDRWNPGDDAFRTTDGGAHWSSLKTSAKLDSSGSPFLNWGQKAPKFGWWMGTIQIDPFRPGHILFGTGATIWGTDDATNVDRNQPTHWSARAQGLEETAVIDLVSPPEGAHLFSALGDIGGFRHDNLRVVSPDGMMLNPLLDNTDSIDFAELNPAVMARVGRGGGGQRQGGFSLDGGKTWKPFPTEPQGSRGSGSIAVSADGKTLIWTPSRLAPSLSRDFGATWISCLGTGVNCEVVSDRANPLRFYAFDGRRGTFYDSNNGGVTFEERSKGLPGLDSSIHVAPGLEGDVWLVGGKTLTHIQDPNNLTSTAIRFDKIANASDVSTIGFGKAAPGKSYPTLCLIGSVDGTEGAFRSDDYGTSWTCITDDQHGFGTMDHIIGDPRIYARVYIGTNGRGVLFGDPLKR